jgi:hypothetical protein
MKNSKIVYYDSFSVAVINSKGQIRRVYCPFIVKCISDIDNIKVNSDVFVEEISTNAKGQLYYRVGILFYKYSNFQIKINF